MKVGSLKKWNMGLLSAVFTIVGSASVYAQTAAVRAPVRGEIDVVSGGRVSVEKINKLKEVMGRDLGIDARTLSKEVDAYLARNGTTVESVEAAFLNIAINAGKTTVLDWTGNNAVMSRVHETLGIQKAVEPKATVEEITTKLGLTASVTGADAECFVNQVNSSAADADPVVSEQLGQKVEYLVSAGLDVDRGKVAVNYTGISGDAAKGLDILASRVIKEIEACSAALVCTTVEAKREVANQAQMELFKEAGMSAEEIKEAEKCFI